MISPITALLTSHDIPSKWDHVMVLVFAWCRCHPSGALRLTAWSVQNIHRICLWNIRMYIYIIIMCIYILIHIYIYDISLPDTVYDIWYDCKFNTLTDMKINGAALHYPTCEHFAFVTCTFWAHEKWGKCFFVRATNPLAFWSLALFVTCTFWAHEKWGKCFFVRATNPLAFWSLALYPLAYSQTL